jgi:hypothetical protein
MSSLQSGVPAVLYQWQPGWHNVLQIMLSIRPLMGFQLTLQGFVVISVESGFS